MKKMLLELLISLVVLCAIPTVLHAQVGDVIGEAYNTDIVAYINHYAIPSFAANGTSVIVAEDLRNFGFNVNWNQGQKSLTISTEPTTKITSMKVSKTTAAPGSKFQNLLESDIVVYAGDKQLTSYVINGYTMIPIEELSMFGEVTWVQEQRSIKLWVNNLPMNSEMQSVNLYISPQEEAQVLTEANKSNYYNIAIQQVKRQLKSPATAIIYPYNDPSIICVYTRSNTKGDAIAILGKLEAMNGFGGYVQTNFMVEEDLNGAINFHYVY